ncbi:MAG TPA: hypothetical protein VFF68_09765, partial [Anaerolineaceae bacterium]|nr:hypothetical protein [Anaerolineaceae bacterium]
HTATPPTSPTAVEQTPQEIVTQLIAAKLKAMEEQDIDAYLSLIDACDNEYYTEQRNWFLHYQEAITAEYSIEIKQVERIDDSTLVSTLEHRYLYGPEKTVRQFENRQKFVLTPDGWKDADLAFEVIETPHFTIKYQPELEAKAAEVAEEAEIGYSSVVSVLGLEAPEKVTIKLYATEELLRQSTDIRVAFLFSGWYEEGESIKLFGLRDRNAFAQVIAHELTHLITLGISDSQTIWLAEGLGVYFGNRPFRGGNPIELGQYTAEDLALPVTWLEETNLIEVTDGETVSLYYALSGMVVEFMVDTYGIDQAKALLAELSTFPRWDRGFDYGPMEVENQARLHQAMETVLGLDQETFNRQWLEWIGAQD